MMVGLDLVVGYLAAWAVRKARRAGESLDHDTDLVLDSWLERLHDLVAAKLGAGAPLEILDAEAEKSGEVSDQARQLVATALAEAADRDQDFATRVARFVTEMQRGGLGGVATGGTVRAAAVGGVAEIRADRGSAAALTMGDVRIGVPPDPPAPGRNGG
jgi:hypothetical protein